MPKHVVLYGFLPMLHLFFSLINCSPFSFYGNIPSLLFSQYNAHKMETYVLYSILCTFYNLHNY
uniref:Uncharacterized protein n=1 Tax=Arundo donax TaxID=35708 RepID=A0A0A8ZLE6_ARUDO